MRIAPKPVRPSPAAPIQKHACASGVLVMPMLLDDLQTVVWPKLVCGHQLAHQCVDGGRIGDVFRTHHRVASRTGWRGDRQPAELDDLLRQRQSFEYADTAADGCRAEVRCGNHVYGTRKVGASQPYPSGGHRTHHSAKRGDLRDDFRATIQCARMLDPVARRNRRAYVTCRRRPDG